MTDNIEKLIAGLGDVELVRLLTVDAKEYSADIIAAATAEANRRGVPIDAAFIPREGDERAPADEEPVDPTESRPYEAGGEPIVCPHCRHAGFQAREIILNTRALTFFNLDWLNRSATALACAKCGQIQLFATPPTAREDDA